MPAATPAASSEQVRGRMSRQRSRDTGPELALRRELHRRGLRYRVDRKPEPDLRTRADLVFPRARVVVFVDGCFWHRCPHHHTEPTANADWWRRKLDANQARDRATDATLTERGWTVIRVWEHEESTTAADRVQLAVAEARASR